MSESSDAFPIVNTSYEDSAITGAKDELTSLLATLQRIRGFVSTAESRLLLEREVNLTTLTTTVDESPVEIPDAADVLVWSAESRVSEDRETLPFQTMERLELLVLLWFLFQGLF